MDSSHNLAPIFVVDDDPDVGLLLQHVLAKSGVQHPLQVWTDPVQALADWAAIEASAHVTADLPLLFLIDLKMPGVNGLELLSWLREQTHLSGRPRIMLSSSLDGRDADVAYSLGANGFLTKYPTPFVMAAIVRFASELDPHAKGASTVFHETST